MPLLGNGQTLIGFNGSNYASSLTGGIGISIINTGVTTTISTNISVGLSLPASVFSVSGSPVTSSGVLTGSLVTQIANTVWAGPNSSSPATPTFRSLVPLDLPPLGDGQIYIGNGMPNAGVPTVSSLSAGTGITITPGAGSLTVAANFLGTVTSVGLALPVSVFSISGSPVTGSGTLTGVFTSQAANTVFAGPNGSAGTPTFRSLVAVDIPNLDTSKLTTGVLPIARGGTNSGTTLNNNRIMISSGGAIVEAAALTNGQVLIGSNGTAPIPATLSAGAGISITNGAGSITIAATNAGTVTSVGLALPSIFTVSGSPVISTGTLTGTLATQTANTVWAGPTTGAAAAPTFRSLVAADIPNLDTSKLTSGILPIARGGTNSNATLNNNRIMVSSGGAIVEAAALSNGQVLIGSNNSAPVPATLTAGSGITITNGAGSVTIANTMTDMSMVIGEVFYEGATVTTTTLFNLVVNTPQELNPVTTLVSTSTFDMPANGRLRYTGAGTITFHCAFSLSGRLGAGATNQLLFFKLRKNGVAVAGGGFQQIFQNANDFQGMAFHKAVSLTTNDYISLFVTDLTATKDFEVFNLNIVVAGSM